MNATKTKIIQRMLACLMIVAMLFTTAGCNKTDEQLPTVGQNNNPDVASFDEYCDELFKELVIQSGFTLHSFVDNPDNLGLGDYNVQIDTMDVNTLTDTSEVTAAINKLKTFKREDLSAKQQLVYDQLMTMFSSSLEYNDLYLYANSLSPSRGIQVQLPILFVQYAFKRQTDIDDYLTLMGQVYDYCEYLIKLEKMKADKGLFMEDFIADAVIEQCSTFLTGLKDNNFLIRTFNEKVDAFEGLSDDDRTRYKTKNAAAINNSLIPGYEYIISELKALKGSAKYSGGLIHKPQGKQYYEYLMKSNLGWDISIEKLDELISDYLVKAITDIQTLSLADKTIVNSLNSYGFSISDPDAIIADLKEKIKEDFPAAPELPYTLKEIDPSLEEFASPAMYFLPPVDNRRQNSIYINKAYLKDATSMYTTLAHEGYPGHMYQNTYANDNCKLRVLISPLGWVEGWASYCETYAYTFADTGNSNLNRVMADNYFATLLIYAKADIGINYYGWGKAELKSFLANYGFNTDAIVDEFYLSMVAEPCVYPAYSVGCLAFIRMRETAINTLGDKYNAKEFHKLLMDLGPFGFDILEPYFNTWLSTQK